MTYHVTSTSYATDECTGEQIANEILVYCGDVEADALRVHAEFTKAYPNMTFNITEHAE